MKNFSTYVEKLNQLLRQVSDARKPFRHDSIAPALNGEPDRMLRLLVDLETRRIHGAFFSGSVFGALLVQHYAKELNSNSLICDPACGGGDLLVAIAKHLPVKGGLKETMKCWGSNLAGLDIHQEFIEATKFRLALQAIALGVDRQLVNDELVLGCFPYIRKGDGLSAKDQIANATHVITNPPFIYVEAREDCSWSRGLVNSAGVFLDYICTHASSGTRVCAILPDVLRSGSRYDKWRKRISSQLKGVRIVQHGQFSQHADVDVFVMYGTIRERILKNQIKDSLLSSTKSNMKSVGDMFDVSVGPVVPHRHPNKGRKHPYLTANNSTPWQRIRNIEATRGFKGTLYKPPFVAIRRTSRSDMTLRAVATLVTDVRKVAVENHLIICAPRSKTIADCLQLTKVLKAPSTQEWLNTRICCRHLTVSSVKSIPMVTE